MRIGKGLGRAPGLPVRISSPLGGPWAWAALACLLFSCSSAPAEIRSIQVGGVRFEFVRIPEGTFTMGDPEEEGNPFFDRHAHEVAISRAFWMQTTEVTQAQWSALMGDAPSEFKGDDRPVERVSWERAMEFARKVAPNADLPTEAEWEYACRAGTRTPWSFGDDSTELGDHAWYRENASDATRPVAGKRPNPWGLYDMHGNVWEWCADRYGPYSGDSVDPRGPSEGDRRVCRGGSWFSNGVLTRSAIRSSHHEPWNTIGFRLVLRE